MVNKDENTENRPLIRTKTKEELWQLIHKDYCEKMGIEYVIDDMNNMGEYHKIYLIGFMEGLEYREDSHD